MWHAEFVTHYVKSTHDALEVCCSVLQCVAVCRDTLQRTATHCNTRQHTATHGNTLQHTSSASSGSHDWGDMWSVLQCVVVCCSVQQCVAVRCSALQCVAVCCTHLPCHMMSSMWRQSTKLIVLHPTSRRATVDFIAYVCRCANLRFIYMWMSQVPTANSQKSALYSFYMADLQHTVTHCNTLQHTATHCNTLQHGRFE